jgi:hypothetical protein
LYRELPRHARAGASVCSDFAGCAGGQFHAVRQRAHSCADRQPITNDFTVWDLDADRLAGSDRFDFADAVAFANADAIANAIADADCVTYTNANAHAHAGSTVPHLRDTWDAANIPGK